MLVVIASAAIFADLLPLKDPLAQDAFGRLLPPGEGFFFGTDNFGRDVFSRIVYGSRSSLYIAIVSVTLGTLIGTVVGTVSAYRGGWVDSLLQRITDALLGFPVLVLAIILVVALRPSANTVMIAIAVGITPQMVRLARSRSLSIKEETFILTARAQGVSSPRIVFKHVLPHAFSPILAYATGYVGIALIAESALNFLGLGVPPPSPTWGGILQESRSYMEAAPWLAVFPGLVLSLTAFSFVFLGDAIRDRLDPRARYSPNNRG
ncbi:ABC transporter permease [Dehalogenimonas sp. THU2]|uniref:ABC transporter permease n=1 Tax=Dehalogenimonas sp. THU2 TaxID=3151121 RepID=UPI00321891EC